MMENYLGKNTPKLGFGLMRLPMLGSEIDIEQTKVMVDEFLANGFTYFDTAYVYGENGASEKAAKAAAAVQTEAPAKKKKLTYKEQKELEQIEKDLEALEVEKAELESRLSAGTLPFDQLQAASERIGKIMEETDEKEMRWLELTDGL